MAGQETDGGWETVTDPADVPAEVRKTLGVARLGAALGAGTGATAAGKPVPAWAKKDFETAYNPFSSLDRALSSFQPDFAGNTVTGDLENTAQALWGGFGTKGQRDWWSDFRTTDNKIRNELFGATLTPSEERSYKATTIAPDMDPDVVRQNLQRRRDILRAATERQYKFLRAQGYSGDAVDALAGVYAPEFSPEIKSQQEQAKGGDSASGAAGAASGSGQPPSDPPPQNKDAGGVVQFGDEGPQMSANAMRLTDEQWQTFQQAAMSGASVDRLAGMATAFGRPPDDAGMENLKAIADYYSKPENRNVPLGVSYERDELKPVDSGDGALGAGARGAGNVLTFGGGDEAGALFDTVANGGTYADNLDRRRGQELFDEQEHGIARGLGQLVGGVPLGMLSIGRNPGAAARAAFVSELRNGTAAAEARSVANRVFATRTALDAAGLGGLYGFGDANGDLGDRALGGGVGAVTGAAAGGALAAGGGRFSRLMADRRRAAPLRGPSEAQQTMAAMDRQGVTPFAPDVGGPVTRLATGATAQTIGGVSPIRRAAQRTLDTAQAVRDRVASSLGVVQNVEQAGETARAGAERYIADTGRRIGRIYDVAESMAGQARVETPEAIRVLDQELAPLLESPVPSEGVAVLQGIRDRLTGPQTVRGLRNMRTTLRDEFERAGLRGSNIERIANRVVDATTDDISNGLADQGLDRAARAYRRADALWRQRLTTIDENLEPILGRNTDKSGEEIVKALKAAMSGNNRRFANFIGALPANEQGIVRASLVSRLGQATKGQQDETGEVFSLSTFLTNWNDIGETAKTTLFGAEGRAALNDLARIASGAKAAQRYANFSNTGAAVTTSALGAAMLAGPIGWITALKAVGAQYAMGRMLASPRFARWVARAPRNASPSQARSHLARLSRIAAKSEPAVAADILSLQQRLADAFGRSPTRLAADERDQERGGVVRQNGERREQRQEASATP